MHMHTDQIPTTGTLFLSQGTFSDAVSRIVDKEVLELLKTITQELSIDDGVKYHAAVRTRSVKDMDKQLGFEGDSAECLQLRGFKECLHVLGFERNGTTFECHNLPLQDVIDKAVGMLSSRIMSLHTKQELEAMIHANKNSIKDLNEEATPSMSQRSRFFSDAKRKIPYYRAQNADYEAALKRRG